MKPIAMLIAAALVGCTASDLETEQSGVTAVTEVVVTAKTLAGVPAGKKYVLDLATGGAIYSLDPSAGPLAFDRMLVSTDEGVEDYRTWVQENVPVELGYSPRTDTLTVGTLEDFQQYWSSQARGAGGFTCNRQYCDCSGVADCIDMIDSGICGGDFVECTRRSGDWRCLCSRSGPLN